MLLDKTKLTAWISRHEIKILYGVFIGAYSVFVLLSNIFDWDHFFTTVEYEFRSWMVFHEMPIWSYGFCAGATRLGDPQSFGLSPFFSIILILGSYWGLKLLVIFLMGLGLWSVHQIGKSLVRIYYRSPPDEQTSKLIFLFATAFTFGNYFLWHSHHGHITFLLHHVILWVMSRLLRVFERSLNKREWALIAFVSFSYFSSAIYHSIIFFLMPIAFSLVPTLLFGIWGGFNPIALWRSKHRAGVLYFLSALITGFLLGSYKLIGVLRYQADNPRVLAAASSSIQESISAIQAALLQLLPTWNYAYHPNVAIGRWGIWEQSSFNLNAHFLMVAFLVAVLPRCIQRGNSLRTFWSQKTPEQKAIIFFFLVAAPLVVISLLLGEQSSFSLFRYVNLLLHGSVRVLGRFQILLLLCTFVGTTLLLAPSSKLKNGFLKLRPLLYLLILLNFFTFNTLSRESFLVQSQVMVAVPEKTQVIYVAPIRDMAHSYMFGGARNGYIVPNCYNPITREIRTFDELFSRNTNIGHPPAPLRPHQIYRIVDMNASEACGLSASISENEIFPGPDCPKDTCFLFNGLSPRDRKSGKFYFNSLKGLYCSN